MKVQTKQERDFLRNHGYHPDQYYVKKNGTVAKKTKHQMVRDHLILHGSISTWEAIQKYRATRLAAIVFNLKDPRKENMNITTEIRPMDGGGTYAMYHFNPQTQII